MGVVLTVIIIVVLVIIIASVASRRGSGSPSAPQPPPRNSAAARTSAAPPTTSGTGPKLTYLLQGHVPQEGWVTAQKSNGQLSGFGTINATDDELSEFAKSVMRPFDNGKRSMRVVFFRGALSFDDLTIENAYGDVTPNEGGKFSRWMFMG